MYLVVEEGARVFRVVVAGLSRVDSIRHARRVCAERGKSVHVRDQDATEGSGVIYTARPESNERRRACDCPATCHGPARHQHSIACRPARPRCRWRRKARGLCGCDRYPFPHRSGSGFCGDEQAYIDHLMKPRHRAA